MTSDRERFKHLIDGHDVWGELQRFLLECSDEKELTALLKLEKKTRNRVSHIARIMARRRFVRKQHEMEELENI